MPRTPADCQPGDPGRPLHTTVEGLLTQVRDDLRSQIFHVEGQGGGGGNGGSGSGEGGTGGGGDSLIVEERDKWHTFFAGLDDAIAGRRDFTVVLSDPLASSYVQSLSDDPGQPDDQMTVEEYRRTDEEEEDLGLKDMKVDGYEGQPSEEGNASRIPRMTCHGSTHVNSFTPTTKSSNRTRK